jgi:hypothetical protein
VQGARCKVQGAGFKISGYTVLVHVSQTSTSLVCVQAKHFK